MKQQLPHLPTAVLAARGPRLAGSAGWAEAPPCCPSTFRCQGKAVGRTSFLQTARGAPVSPIAAGPAEWEGSGR